MTLDETKDLLRTLEAEFSCFLREKTPESYKTFTPPLLSKRSQFTEVTCEKIEPPV